MQVTVEQYARMRGVSVGTIQWMTAPPAERPPSNGYLAEVPEVFCPVYRYARLLGCDDRAVRYRIMRGHLAVNEDGALAIHASDLRWGMSYFDIVEDEDGDGSESEEAPRATCFYQAVERQLVRLGHLQAEGLIEAQLTCIARSPEWWRRQREATKAADEVLSQTAGKRKANGGRGCGVALKATAPARTPKLL